MTYTLTLTADERAALDWVGGRYAGSSAVRSIVSGVVGDAWDSPDDVAAEISESQAWEISEAASTDDGHWPCLDRELRDKLDDLVDSIV